MAELQPESTKKHIIDELIKKAAITEVKLLVLETFLAGLLTILFSFGLVFHFFLSPPSILFTLSEAFIFTANLLVTIMILTRGILQGRSSFFGLVTWMVIAFVATICIEIFGVQTGAIFGQYSYGSTFDFNILGVPWVIGWNWVLVIMGITILTRSLYQKVLSFSFFRFIQESSIIQLAQNPWFWFIRNFDIALLSGLMAVLFDYPLEIVAMKFDFWQWSEGVVPLQNYFAWFAITFVFSLYALKFKILPHSRIAPFYAVIQWIFFIILII